MESELVKFTDRKNQICEYLKINDKLKKEANVLYILTSHRM